MSHIDIVFDGPPAPESGRFIEVEDASGTSIRIGEWVERDDGYCCLRLPDFREDDADVLAVVDEQAKDEALWFEAQTAPEAYLQQALRRLHSVIEKGDDR